jgi:hypothetical protein
MLYFSIVLARRMRKARKVRKVREERKTGKKTPSNLPLSPKDVILPRVRKNTHKS